MKVELRGRADQLDILQAKFLAGAQSLADSRKHRGLVRVSGPAPVLEEKTGAAPDESFLRWSFADLAHIIKSPHFLGNARRP